MSKRAVAYYPMSRRRPAASPLHEQTRSVMEKVRARGWVLIEPFVEAPSAHGDRPELARALARCKESRATLVVPELPPIGADRRFLEAVLAAHVRVVACDGSRAGPSTLRLLHEVALRTHDDVSARTREALRVARQRGVRLGSPRPEIGSRVGVIRLRALADARARDLAPQVAEIRLSNPDASLRGIAQILEEIRVPTARGGTWGPSGVRNVLQRLSAAAS